MALFFPPRRTPVLVSAGLMLGLVAGLRAGPFFVDRGRGRAQDGRAAGVVTGGAAWANSCTTSSPESGHLFVQGTPVTGPDAGGQ